MTRLPAHDLEAEQIAIASALHRNGERVADWLAVVRSEMLSRTEHRVIWDAIVALSEQGRDVRAAGVRSHLRQAGKLGEDVVKALDAVGSAAVSLRTDDVGARVRRHWLIRETTSDLSEALREGDQGRDAQEWIDEVIGRLSSRSASVSSTKLVHVKDVISDSFRRIVEAEARAKSGQLAGITTGLRDLDQATSGMRAGDLWIVAGRPGMGKTSFATKMAVEAAADETRDTRTGVAFFSLEMPLDQFGSRLAAMESRQNLGCLRHGVGINWDHMTQAAQYLSTLPMHFAEDVDGAADLARQSQLAKTRVEAAKYDRPAKLGVVIVDYLQLMRSDGRQRKSDTREQELAAISKGLKRMAKQLGVCVVALAQLSRKCEERADKRPMLSDLRESGALEQDADLVAFLYRDEMYNPNTQEKGVSEVLIAKQRNGPTGTVKVAFASGSTRFDNLEGGHQ